MLAAPDVRQRVERFAQIFGERHFPLYAPFFDYYMEDGDEPPWTWLRRGIPFDLMGFGYDGLHEMWDGYRDGLSALVLLAKPPDSFYEEPDGLRVAWLESAAARIPQQTLLRGSPKEAYPWTPSPKRSRGAGSRGRRRPAPGSGPRPATSSSTTATTTACTRGSPTPGRKRLSRRAPRSGAGPAPSWTR